MSARRRLHRARHQEPAAASTAAALDELPALIDQAGTSPCLMCGGIVAYVGIYQPIASFARRLGGRIIVYGLCESCKDHHDNPCRIERRLLADAVAARGDPGAN